MIVGDLLHLDDLGIRLAWSAPQLLDRPVTGISSTDLQDPARYLQTGELVLTGLVWWRPADATGALRFATALRSAGVAALLAGEGTHGSIPVSLAEACRTHGIPLLAVPAGTSFRAVTDRVYLRLWGDLRAGSPDTAAIPEAVRHDVLDLIHAGAEPGEVLTHAVGRLGVPDCSIVTAGGRPVAATATPVPSAVRGDAGLPVGPQDGSPFDGWRLRPHTRAAAAEPMLRALADLLAPLAVRDRAAAVARHRAGGRLLDVLAGDGGLAEPLAACELGEARALVAVTARIDDARAEADDDGTPARWAAHALAEALHPLGVPFAAGTDRAGRAGALVAAPVDRVAERLRRARPALQARLTGRRTLRVGVGPAAPPDPAALRAALVQARYVLEGSAGPVGSAAELDSLAGLLRGIPAEVTAAFHTRLLAPLAAHDRENGVSLLGTLAVFLDHDGSWARTAEQLHVHVNTVHYRIRRIEELTGRNLARLHDRLDLRAALLCAPEPVPVPAQGAGPRSASAVTGRRPAAAGR
ncbi:helix-turn-helix domain-containing protein [Streptomyces sp. SP17BM10]|uniref:helix-turn-helix domain-containing protein n=1 Tax=Streptomyces sp. SP17BM10 TaxID=3002530 RepID=UPI002E78C81E|nr:helix-turn-helix domain-containing protein [Streptomyces sp. SP17BM10]MEE1782494.1 helix-turn-helix domain-containing protein [Streptomyces sp. SP17BM10]